MPDISSLKELSPIVGVTLISSSVFFLISKRFSESIEKLTAIHSEAHERKTRAFLEETQKYHQDYKEMSVSVLGVVKENALALQQNTETTKQTKDAISELLSQLIKQKQ